MTTTLTAVLAHGLATIQHLALQTGFYSRMEDHNWFDAWLFLWGTRIGRSGFAMVIGGAFFVGLWTWTESITPPATFLALFSGVALAQWPGPAARLGYALIGLTIAIGLFAIARRGL